MCLAVPGEVLTVDDAGALPLARVSFGGVVKEVCVAYAAEARPGDFVLVHAGFAIAVLSADAARRALAELSCAERGA
jgi:hydrogenase expression/formation protein HypC